MRADRDHEGGTDEDPDRGAGKRGDDRPAGGEGVRAQDRKRPEDDPEAVLQTGALGDVDGDREADRAAQRVAEPDVTWVRMLERGSFGRSQSVANGPFVGFRHVVAARDERIPSGLLARAGESADAERGL